MGYGGHMYKSLQIENFRGLRHLDVPRLAPVTILTGRNNVGKTTVLESLFLHAGGPRAAQLLLTLLRPYRQPGVAPNIEFSRYATPWETAFYDRDPSKRIRLIGQIDRHKITIELSIPRENLPSHIPSGLRSGEATSATTFASVPAFSYEMRILIDDKSILPDELKHREYTQSVSAQIGQTFFGASGLQQIAGVNFDLKPEEDSDALVLSNFISPQGRSSSVELAQRYTNLRLRKREGGFLNAMRAIEPAIDTIEVLFSGTPALYVSLQGGPLLPLSAMGEGMISVANYAAAIFDTDGGLILIDEVENGIHYTALERLWRQIGQAVKDTGTQVVASTHSYECVRAAYQAFQGDPDTLQLVRLQQGDDAPAAVAAVDYDLETLEGALDMSLDLR